MLNLDVDTSDEETFNRTFDQEDPTEFIAKSKTQDSDNDSDVEEEIIDGPGKQVLKAAQNGNLEELKMLLDEDPTLISYKDSDQYTALHRASYSDQVDAVKFLLARGGDLTAKTELGWVPLHSACRWNSSRCAKVLLEHGADINALTSGGISPLHFAAENSIARETLIVLLLNPNLNPDIKNPRGETGEQVASQNGSFAYLFELVRKSILNI